ncbi:hypothetical protein TrST_g11536 [Triparma strigata]|uniref:Linalool dehydratase/isomerase domain-containing protein n=1 Tax=Triparma strigata TaxID=1606541 RepID=A0A9W7F2P2_9STRA|nr:hypothetical protein TrST_g11536 [Triparma strigata]
MLPFLLIFLLPCAFSTLTFEPGSLDGTLFSPVGLTDKQLAIFSWLEGLVYEAGSTGGWPDVYKTNETGNLPTQRGMPSYRYSLAFTGYAAAAKAITHTPMHTKPTFDLLSTIFNLMVREEVYSYWGQKGDCAPFFLTTYCEKYNTSMCDLDEAWHGKDATRCPDPVYFGNIMYSGHLAHIGALVHLFARTPDEAEEALKFKVGTTDYTLDSLVSRLVFQAEGQRDVLGGGITCEPANVYPSCQSHLHASLRLLATEDSAKESRFSAIRKNWQEYLLLDNIAKGWDSPVGSTPFGERIFEIAQQTPRHPSIPDFGIPIGCASHDVWVLAYLRSWALDNADTPAPDPSYVLARGRELLKNHAGWKDGQLQDERCKVLAGEENWDVASAMYPVVEAAVSDGDFEKSNEAILRFEKQSGSGVNTMWYTSEFGLDVFVTTQLAMSFVMDNTTMVNLHGAAGVKKLARIKGEGYINEVEGDVFVRRAKKGDKALDVTLVAAGEGGEEVRVRIGGLNEVEGLNATMNGQKVSLSFEGEELVVEGHVKNGVDSNFIVTWT